MSTLYTYDMKLIVRMRHFDLALDGINNTMHVYDKL